MATIASLNVELSANVAKFTAAIDKASASWSGMQKSLSLIKYDAIVNLGERAFHAGQQIYESGKAIASMANDIEKQSRVMGVSIANWQKLTYAARMNDASNQALNTGLKILSNNIMESQKSGSEMESIFRTLGITGTDLQGVMGQIADRFEAATDGSDKIAYATKLFGRNAMELIPMLNQGSRGIKEWGDRAEQTGSIIEDSIINKGSEVEQKFKDFAVSMETLKLKSIPIIDSFTKILDLLTGIGRVIDKIANAKVDLFGMEWGWGGLKRKTSEAVFPVNEGVGEKRITLPPITGAKGEGHPFRFSGSNNPLEAYMDQSEKYAEIVDKVIKETNALNEKVADLAINQSIKSEGEFLENALKDLKEFNDELAKQAKLFGDMDIARVGEEYEAMLKAGDEAAEASRKDLEKTIEDTAKKAKEAKQPWIDAARDVSMAWIVGFEGMGFFGWEWKDVMDNVFSSILNSFNRMAERMLDKWITSLFEMESAAQSTNTGGGASAGGGGGGAFGGLISMLLGGPNVTGIAGTGTVSVPGTGYWPGVATYMAEGGIVSRPTLGMVGEAGPEAVIPLRNGRVPMEGGGGTQIYFINPIGFSEALMQNMGTVISGLGKNSRARGPANSIIRNG